MGQSVRVDQEQLRAMVAEFENIGTEAQRLLGQLKAAIGHEGNCWDDDPAGQTSGRAEIRVEPFSAPTDQNPPSSQHAIPATSAASGPRLLRIEPDSDASDRPALHSPDTAIIPGSAQHYPPPDVPTSRLSDNTAGPVDPVGATDGHDSGEERQGAQLTLVGAAPTAAPDFATPATSTRAAADVQTAGRTLPNTPWSKRVSGMGPSNTSVSHSPSQASMPGSDPPEVCVPSNLPRLTAPPFPERHDRWPAPKATGKTPGAESKSTGHHPWASHSALVDENIRIARELAERHDLEVIGFDTPGVDRHTVRELAAALDDVLTQYPHADVRQIAIAESADAATCLEWDWVAGAEGPEPFTRRIVFDAAVARNPDEFVESVCTATQSGKLARGSDRRPVYSTVIREVGHALDIAGGFRARPAAQDVLIAEFTRIRGTRAPEDSTTAPTAEFEQWRAQLSGYGLRDGRFDPGMALADAFTEVQLNGQDAGPAAKVLHRLVVETARLSSTAQP
ncbi:hypothetical protein AB0B25_13920 [Nocardia sp. NPDC049190]|uniref:hypothetical protein n=1 Tax=Nocardia sp. NPDC049190 TaxID=3155650 RepID=UPI0034061869